MTDWGPGTMLIAAPRCPDRRFRGSVLMLTDCDDQGDRAVCLNRPLTLRLGDVLTLSTGSIPDLELYWGGPVNTHSLWMLHTQDWHGLGTRPIDSTWAITSSPSMFDQFTQGHVPQYLRLFLGHCGWAPNQLRREFEGQHPWRPEHSWLVAASPSPEWLMEQSCADTWEQATQLSRAQAVSSWL